MSTITIPHNFSDNTNALAAKVNANFDEVEGFLNASVVHADGSKAFTGLPALPGDPTAANQPTRKQYVDDKFSAASAAATTAENNAKAYTDTKVVDKVSGAAMTGTSPLEGVYGGQPFQLRAGSVVGTTDAFGDVFVDWANFPNGLAGITVSLFGDFADSRSSTVLVRAPTRNSCLVRLSDPTNGVSRNNHAIQVTWVAVGF